MINKKMAILYGKAFVVIFVLCFTAVQLAAIGRKQSNSNGEHLRREKSENVNDAVNLPDMDLQAPVVQDIPQKAAAVINGANDKFQKSFDLNDKLKQPQENFVVNKQGDENVPDDLKPDEDREEVREQIDKPEKDEVIVEDVDNRDSQIEQPKDKVIEHDADGDDDEDDDDDDEEDEDDEDDDEEEEDDEFPAHRLDRLSLKELQPPDHMEAVKMEQDGHLNKDYKKEIIIGNHEEFEQDSNSDPEDLLEQIFKRVDSDNDNFISLLELETWIIDKVQEHFDEAITEAERIFKHLDSKNKGYITWQEFHVHFLIAKGHDLKEARKHAHDYETISLDPEDKEVLIRYKFRWAEADEDPQDNKLTMAEFKAFRHPEQSKAMIDRMVQDIIENLDHDNDGVVTEEEFVALPPGEVDGQYIESDRQWQEERRREFRVVIDINHDGKVVRDELKNYVDPQNPNHARLEAENLVELADENKDDKLSLDEVLDNIELFLGSKMVDTGKNFHDEF